MDRLSRTSWAVMRLVFCRSESSSAKSLLTGVISGMSKIDPSWPTEAAAGLVAPHYLIAGDSEEEEEEDEEEEDKKQEEEEDSQDEQDGYSE